MKIGIGLTTHNRNAIAKQSVFGIIRSTTFLYDCELVIVDDCSDTPYDGLCFRFDTNVGISTAKNKCIELLYDVGCTHFFLFDDDVCPVNADWWKRYIDSGLEHACWNYNRKVIEFGIQATATPPEYNPVLKEYVVLDKPNGCMLYARRGVIDAVGGWDVDFKGYGYDHVNWSDRIFNNGLTPARYIDIPNSSHLFKMADCETSVSYDIRVSTIPINERLYQQKFYSKEFKPFK